MAGIQAESQRRRREADSTRMREHYDIEYARFFNYPISPSATMASPPALVKSLSKSRLLRNGGGTWLSASSPASLHLFTDHTTCLSFPRVVLVVSLRERIHEEHFISKLHFSWPQVSCVSQCSVRGSRVVFVSYKDCVGQIQKFAMRFQDSVESQIFINSLKDTFKDVSGIMTPSNNFRSKNLCQNDFATMSRVHHGVQYTYPGESPHEDVGASTLLPPSFTEFLADGFTEVQQEPPAVAEKVDLKTYIASYMSTSSFNDMLNTLEQVISDMGGDLSLPL